MLSDSVLQQVVVVGSLVPLAEDDCRKNAHGEGVVEDEPRLRS